MVTCRSLGGPHNPGKWGPRVRIFGARFSHDTEPSSLVPRLFTIQGEMCVESLGTRLEPRTYPGLGRATWHAVFMQFTEDRY